MFHHILSGFLAEHVDRRIERWVAGGRTHAAAEDETGARWILRFGTRFRIRSVITCAVFACACGAAVVLKLAGIPVGFWLELGYAVVIVPAFLLSVFQAGRTCLMTVVLSDAQITARFGPWQTTTLDWSRVARVRYSPIWSTFVIEGVDGCRLRIPSQMDGQRTLSDFFARLDATVIDPAAGKQLVQLFTESLPD